MQGDHWQWSAAALLSVLITQLILINTSLAQQPSEADAARLKCDRAAGHPRDPDRYLAGVPDSELHPGPARESCEPAVRLNPDVARMWFQLGRAYWAVGRDSEAFRAFNEAASRDYAAAKKYMGDAYYLGRGLPTGQKQDAQRALELYRQAAEGGFDEALLAMREIDAKIKEQEKAKFDASIFQRPDIMGMLYTLESSASAMRDRAALTLYLKGFVDQFAGEHTPILFLTDGHYCKPLLRGETYAAIKWAATTNLGNGSSNILTTIMKSKNQGESDALTLFTRYGCKGPVTLQLMNNLNDIFSVKNSTSEIGGAVHERGQAPTGKCVATFNGWKAAAKQYGAFATSPSYCGWSHKQSNPQRAREVALENCNGDCKIYFELYKP